MNSVVRKVLLVLAVTLGVYAAILYTFVQLVVVRSFNELQVSDATAETERCRLIINKEVAIVAGLCEDWATWDDAYRFVADRNDEFVKSTLDPAIFKLNHLNTIIFTDTQGKVVWRKSYDLSTGKEIDSPALSQEEILNNPLYYAHHSVNSSRSGLVLVNDCPMIVSTSPIITSRREGPIRGTLIMARFLSKDQVSALADSVGTSFTLVPLKETSFRPLVGHDYAVQKLSHNRIGVCRVMNDLFGRPTMALVTDMDTPISSRGRWVGVFISFSVIAAGVITLLVTFTLLKRFIMRRLEELGHAIEKVASSSATEHSSDEGVDELARHTEMVMDVISRLDSTEHALDASYQRFWSAFFSAPYPMMIHDEDGRILQINKQWTRLTGYTCHDITTTAEWCRRACGSTADASLLEMNALYKLAERHDHGDAAITTSDGRTLTWSLSSAPIGLSPEGKRQVITMAVDITVRQRAQQTLRDNESLFRSLTESIPAVTYLAEPTRDARFIYLSPQARTFFSCQVSDLRESDCPWKRIIDSSEYDAVMDSRYLTVSERQHFVRDYRGIGSSGQTVRFHEEAQIVSTAKGPMIQGVIFDVTAGRLVPAAASLS
jgi:PAS domain S-box-containing protein